MNVSVASVTIAFLVVWIAGAPVWTLLPGLIAEVIQEGADA